MELDISYNKIKRLSNDELAGLWAQYFDNHENKELRDVLRNKGIILGVHMRTKTAIDLIKDNPKDKL